MLRTCSTALASLLLPVLLLVPATHAQDSGEVRLGPAPTPPPWLNLSVKSRIFNKAGLAVDTQNRTAVANFFDTNYTPALAVPINWTGSIAGCVAGTTSQAYLDATFQIINYYRAMTGLPDVGNLTSLNDDSQEAALMMIAEGALDHFPPPEWACYTANGDAAAGASNLALGNAGPSAMVAYIRDSGSFNFDVGHRRWILYPLQSMMASGSNDGVNVFSGANDLYVLATSTWIPRPASPDEVAWPPEGYVPYQVVYDRWSFSLNSNPSADYSSATVTMTSGGSPVSLNIVSTAATFGDKTIVWEPSGLSMGPGMSDLTVTVTVASIGSSSTTSATYDVIIIDPAIIPDQIFADGFESGDTSMWSDSVP